MASQNRALADMRIRNKVIISVVNRQEVLLSEGYDPVRDFRFYIPVGGGVEFGETIHAAAKRELFEELGIRDQSLAFIEFHESFFEFNGTQEHEIMFHFVCHISDEQRNLLAPTGIESSGEQFPIAWHSRGSLESIKKSLVPPEIFHDLTNIL